MNDQVLDRLRALGLELPEVAGAVADYVPWVASGGLVLVSGQLPMRAGKLMAAGSVPGTVSVAEASDAARLCALNALAAAGAAVEGDWSRLVRAVRLGVFVQSDPGFDAQHTVANGASRLLVEVLGEAGRHARAAVGVAGLPLNASVEVEAVFEVRGGGEGAEGLRG